jgi:hypothetical protein
MSINKETLKYTYHFVAGAADSAKLKHPTTGREIYPDDGTHRAGQCVVV